MKKKNSNQTVGETIDEFSQEGTIRRFRQLLEEDHDRIEMWENGTPHQQMLARGVKAISKIDIEKPNKADVDLSGKSPQELATLVVNSIKMTQKGNHSDVVGMQRSFYEEHLQNMNEGEYIEYLEQLAEEIDRKWSGLYSGIIWLVFGGDCETARMNARRLTKGYWEKKNTVQ